MRCVPAAYIANGRKIAWVRLMTLTSELPAVRDSLTAGALLSLIAHSHEMSLVELLVTAQVCPKKLLGLLKELHKANLIEVSGVSNLSELDDMFERHQSKTLDTSEVPYVRERRDLMGELAEVRPASKVSISRKGFSKALVL